MSSSLRLAASSLVSTNSVRCRRVSRKSLLFCTQLLPCREERRGEKRGGEERRGEGRGGEGRGGEGRGGEGRGGEGRGGEERRGEERRGEERRERRGGEGNIVKE